MHGAWRVRWRAGLASIAFAAMSGLGTGCIETPLASYPRPVLTDGSQPASISREFAEPEQGDGVTVATAEHTTLVTADYESDAETELLPSPGPTDDKTYPIDLVTALRLAGANNLQIALAVERVNEAVARLDQAKYHWLPTISVGLGYNKHDGRIQRTEGDVIEVSRNSLFVGGGAALGWFPVTGGSGGPPRLMVDWSIAEAWFWPLAERQMVRAAEASQVAAFNDTLLAVALAYLDLSQAQGEVEVAREAVRNAERLSELVRNRVHAGTALPADGHRADNELARRRRLLVVAQERVRVASAELVRLLRLEPGIRLEAAGVPAVPLCLIPEETPLPDLIAKAWSARPELASYQALVEASLERLRQEQVRPWLPHLRIGFGLGGFGGGQGSDFLNFSDRTDVDALVVWELRNLGLGNAALQRQRFSQTVQAQMTAAQIRDNIAAEVARAYYQVLLRKKAIEAAAEQARTAADGLPLNFQGIFGGELRAIEAQQAVASLAQARREYLAAVHDYNRAQFALLRAIGEPIDATPFPSQTTSSKGTTEAAPADKIIQVSTPTTLLP